MHTMAWPSLLVALSLAGHIAAQCSGTTTISNAGDASAVASCNTWTGDIVIATGASDDIELDGLRQIQGSLIMNDNTEVSTLSGNSLSQIEDTFQLNAAQLLATLNFPSLAAVDVIDWNGLPNLQGLSLTTGLQLASTVSIQNTGLSSLEGINVQTVDTLLVVNNQFLKTFSMQVASVSTSLVIEANGENTDIDFPNLVWAYNMTFQNCSTINVVSLIAINGSAGFSSNYFNKFQTPVLAQVGGTLSFHDNPQLSSMALLAVESIGGGLQITNNEKFTLIYGFENLANVGGDVDTSGPFTSLELPSLRKVDGDFTVDSPESIGDVCDRFESLARSENAVKGTFTCNDIVVQPSSSQSEGGSRADSAAGSSSQPGSQSDSTGSATSGLSTGAKAGIGVGVGVGGALLIVAAVAVVLLRRRRKARSATDQSPNTVVEVKDSRAMLGNDTQRHELEHPAAQLPEGREAQELPARRGQGELGRSTSGKPSGVESRHELPTNDR